MTEHSFIKVSFEGDQFVPFDAAPRFLTSYARVLLLISASPELITRDIAESLGLTERATQRIISQLVAADYLVRSRAGKRNRYEVNHERPVWKGTSEQRTVGDLIAFAKLPTRPSLSGPL